MPDAPTFCQRGACQRGTIQRGTFQRGTFQRGNETPLTYRLKWAAWEWLYTGAQCRCVGMEVRLEGPAGRVVDLVGVGPGNTIYLVEVKASRADFARDDHTLEELAALKAQDATWAGRIQLAQRTLTQAASYAKIKHPESWQEAFPYQQALADLQRLTKRQQSYLDRLATYSVKFHDPKFLAIADYNYLIAPPGVIPRKRVPIQWGLLTETPDVVVTAPKQEIRKNPGIISNVLRAIARSNTTSMMRAQGVRFEQEGDQL